MWQQHAGNHGHTQPCLLGHQQLELTSPLMHTLFHPGSSRLRQMPVSPDGIHTLSLNTYEVSSTRTATKFDGDFGAQVGIAI